MLRHPKLKKRTDGSMPKTNSIVRRIESIFDDFDNVSFYFFTDRNGDVKDIVWKTIIIDSDDEKDLIEKLTSFVGEEKLREEIQLLQTYSINLQYILFDDNNKWKERQGTIFVASFDIHTCEFDKIERLSLGDFEKLLLTIQGGPMVMNKPLIYSTSSLEGYLSDMCQKELNPVNRAIFPGDVDVVIYNENKVEYLIELKKHTIYGPISDQTFTKYWYKDMKKYRGLASLSRKFNLSFFINFIYSTSQDHNKIKLEKIGTDLKLIENRIITFKDEQDLKRKIKEYLENSN